MSKYVCVQEKEVTRQGDDSDLLSILDFNFTLEQVLARIATNIGWVRFFYVHDSSMPGNQDTGHRQNTGHMAQDTGRTT